MRDHLCCKGQIAPREEVLVQEQFTFVFLAGFFDNSQLEAKVNAPLAGQRAAGI